MAKIKKKKLRLKKKNFLILILIITSLVMTIKISTTKIIELVSNTKKTTEKNTPTKNTPKKKPPKEQENPKPKTELELKLEKLNYINKELDYFKEEYIDRYISYKEKNENIDIKQVILDVNIGLDHEGYTNTKKATDIDKSYILVNKYNYLAEDYVPENLERINSKFTEGNMRLVNYAKESFEKMASAISKNSKLKIVAISSYRSYDYQIELYNRYVKIDGKTKADTYSARPGFSEHQTGLAVDISNGKLSYTDFDQTKEFTWMMENAHKYGFILRYTKDNEKITGYINEPWHYRYVGEKIATYIKENNITYEEYYVKFIDEKTPPASN